MSDTAIVLSLRAPLERPLDAAAFRLDRLHEASLSEVLKTPLHDDGGARELGELFAGRGEPSPRVRLEGDFTLASGLGAGMAGGELIVDGNAGPNLGAGMTDGRIKVRGSTGSFAGIGMAGGMIEIHGDAGAGAGGAAPGARRGMSGGEIIVRGSAGPELGRSMRRGLIAVAGDAAPYAGLNMIAGTILVCGAAGAGAGTWSKRGSIVALGSLTPPPTYRYACTYQPVHLRFTLQYLRRRGGLPLEGRHISGFYRRYSGDLAELGRGEILAWTPE